MIVGRGSIIGANSVCNKSIGKYSIAAGNPIKVIRKKNDQKTIKEIEDSKWWDWDVKKIKENKNFFYKNREEK